MHWNISVNACTTGYWPRSASSLDTVMPINKGVLVTDGWLDRDWTQNPISVQCLSKPCPMSVQSQEKYKVCPIKYRICPKSVEYLSNSETVGQRLDIEIQHLSRHCPMKIIRRGSFIIFVQCFFKSNVCPDFLESMKLPLLIIFPVQVS